ncbi:MAG TPA: PASTA domain-containing protein [Firmicutes bacterium]|nr:PASTA domain-containing protein [Bacillota bacterium]
MYPGIAIRKRIASLFVIWALLLGLLAARLAYIQVLQHDRFRKLALDQRFYPVPVDARRGAIRDRNGHELAISVSADSIYAVPAEIKDPAEVAAKLSRILGENEGELQRRLTQRQATVWIRRKVDEKIAREVKKLGIPGIGFTEKGQRFYPKDSLAAHLLGIAGIDNQGLEGLEFEYDRYLAGVRGQIEAERDATGREIPGGARRFVPPKDGNDLYLTIDEVIQYVAERELDKAMADTKSKRGIVIAMAPKTGEVLAMASRPTFNPNHFLDYPDINRRNIALTDMYEPGSTFKIITAAAALEEGVVRPDSQFYDPGFIKVEDRVIRCWLPGGHGSENFVEATENSCNPVFASLGINLGVDKFYKYIKAFGFGQPTGIDYPGEASGSLQSPKRVGKVELANIAFGQGISVTPLQLLSAACAIANGGTLMKPMLVKKIVAPDGKVVKEFQPIPVRQVISPSTSRELSSILESVVLNGSGVRAQIPGYRVAGKTGTAEKPEGGRYGDKRISSFLGFAPVDDPAIAVLVVLDEPSSGITYGGVIAAPVFKAIVEDALRYMGIPPSKDVKVKENKDGATGDLTVVPDVRGFNLEDAKVVLDSNGLVMRAEGPPDKVRDQIPKPGARVPYGTTVILYFTSSGRYNEVDLKVTVPDLKGLSMKEAALSLGEIGLRMNATGSGWVVDQDPKPGTEVVRGTVVTVDFAEKQ